MSPAPQIFPCTCTQHLTYLRTRLFATGTLYEGAAGRTNLAVDSNPWSLDTLTIMASMTKLPAVISVLQVVERGLLTLNEDLRPRLKALGETHILRGFDEATGQPIYEQITAPITLQNLLTHTSGFVYDLTTELLMRWRQVSGNMKIHNTWTFEGLHTPLLFAPGTEWNYGTGIDWATLALEQVTGQSLNDYASKNFFRPLGMMNSFIGPANAAKSTKELLTRLAGIPLRTPEGALLPGEFPYPLDKSEIESGGAGLVSTARDYSKLLQAVLQGKLLNEKSMGLLFKPQLEGELLKSMREKLAVFRPALAPEYEDGTPANFAFGGMTNMEDIPGKRPKGALMWSGYTNPHWVSLCFDSPISC